MAAKYTLYVITEYDKRQMLENVYLLQFIVMWFESWLRSEDALD